MKAPLWCTFVGVLAMASPRLDAASDFDVRIPGVAGPGDPIVVYLDVTSNRANVASVGARLTYNAAAVSLVSVAKGADAPASWSFIYEEKGTTGLVDVVLTDETIAAATISTPNAAEMVKLTFSRVGGGCGASSYGFNAAAPAAGAATNAFPVNQYVIYVGTNVVLETATTAAASGPATADHSFIRGNISNRGAHILDIQDVVDLVSFLFGGFDPGIDCEAAFDVDNNGGSNITDVVALVQGLFGTAGYVIPPPVSAPGVAVIDGGTVSSVLGCNIGETCP